MLSHGHRRDRGLRPKQQPTHGIEVGRVTGGDRDLGHLAAGGVHATGQLGQLGRHAPEIVGREDEPGMLGTPALVGGEFQVDPGRSRAVSAAQQLEPIGFISAPAAAFVAAAAGEDGRQAQVRDDREQLIGAGTG